MKKRMTKSSGNIFLDLGFPAHEASAMLLRAKLAEALHKWMEREGLTQVQAAKGLRITQPRVSEIVRGKVELMSLDYLWDFAPRRRWTWACVWLRETNGAIKFAGNCHLAKCSDSLSSFPYCCSWPRASRPPPMRSRHGAPGSNRRRPFPQPSRPFFRTRVNWPACVRTMSGSRAGRRSRLRLRGTKSLPDWW